MKNRLDLAVVRMTVPILMVVLGCSLMPNVSSTPNGTDKLEGDTEKDVIRRAFGLWSAQTALTFSETTDENAANIIVSETLVTGIDPSNPDLDSDGLVDGVEVTNQMNPLDPDMDKDCLSDGQEVDQGTDRFFRQQSDISPELEQDVSDLLTNAIELEIEAYRNESADIAASVLAGDLLATLEENIASLNQQGLVMISQIDYYQSFIHDIRALDNTHIEVDTCEVWTNETYNKSSGELVNVEGPTLPPQTITIQQIDSNWYITAVQFYDTPAFCS